MEPKEFVRLVMESLVAVRHLAPMEGPNKMSCLAGSCSYTINWQGEMCPCVCLSQPAASVFEVGFAAAWQHIRAEVDKIVLSSRCAQCPLRIICRNCAAAALSETGSHDGTPEYLCRYAQEMMRVLTREGEHIRRLHEQAQTPKD